MRPTICSLFEPHYKQNLYTNPKRTAKSFVRLNILIDAPANPFVQIFFKEFFFAGRRTAAAQPLTGLQLSFASITTQVKGLLFERLFCPALSECR